ncbi:hypothetical protein PTT_11561 [Pyrenophora teres f. teres 0-1]|uniref:Uncharacterized protein n=1 Tax=Pyrenophora teres f. teres (strain 0-1) TaxID=861557 RepID=E3RRT5_PYRTT|nr:hypothetical protein PTT_11561 [Pyrenophora teres f. teres 0-1]
MYGCELSGKLGLTSGPNFRPGKTRRAGSNWPITNFAVWSKCYQSWYQASQASSRPTA